MRRKEQTKAIRNQKKKQKEALAHLIANNATIRIEHRNNFEDKVFAQNVCVDGIAREEVDGAFDCPARCRLPRVYPCGEENDLPIFSILDTGGEGSDSQEVAAIPLQCLAQLPPAETQRSARACLQSSQVFLEC